VAIDSGDSRASGFPLSWHSHMPQPGLQETSIESVFDVVAVDSINKGPSYKNRLNFIIVCWTPKFVRGFLKYFLPVNNL